MGKLKDWVIHVSKRFFFFLGSDNISAGWAKDGFQQSIDSRFFCLSLYLPVWILSFFFVFSSAFLSKDNYQMASLRSFMVPIYKAYLSNAKGRRWMSVPSRY